ncbi:tumor necrosis factor receptor superfamily member 23-like [Trichosurus vulpecula]|uniref:tumor necrosis factor receptor superfamily member 23-like n=1 Tax=Trichosurus vulpecula TaxID=9337 RepID=UPI00186B17BF|nr:tumor necrosis factor receptor superfamily member 23-like [Trichosurus vulpecula]
MRGVAALTAQLVLRKSETALLSKQNYRKSGGSCDSEKEYWHEGRCCSYCPAGTRVGKHCDISHTLGDCQECPLGEYAPKNGLETCRQCTQCREDQEMLIPCYKYMNTKCQCKEGYFCDAPDCKVCQPCMKKCPEGKQILQGCNATADILCGVSGTGITFRAESSAVRDTLLILIWTLITTHLEYCRILINVLAFSLPMTAHSPCRHQTKLLKHSFGHV